MTIADSAQDWISRLLQHGGWCGYATGIEESVEYAGEFFRRLVRSGLLRRTRFCRGVAKEGVGAQPHGLHSSTVVGDVLDYTTVR